MSELSSMKQTEAAGVDFIVPPLQPPDVASTAEVILTKAMEFCAQKMGFDSSQTVVERLRQGDSATCGYCHYGLAKQVAEFLGTMDEDVRAVYVWDYDDTSDGLCFLSETKPTSLIHLVVWAQLDTAALYSLVVALDRALTQNYADLIGAPQLRHLLDVQVVDDADVQGRAGYGALLSSFYNRPIQIWKR